MTPVSSSIVSVVEFEERVVENHHDEAIRGAEEDEDDRGDHVCAECESSVRKRVERYGKEVERVPAPIDGDVRRGPINDCSWAYRIADKPGFPTLLHGATSGLQGFGTVESPSLDR